VAIIVLAVVRKLHRGANRGCAFGWDSSMLLLRRTLFLGLLLFLDNSLFWLLPLQRLLLQQHVYNLHFGDLFNKLFNIGFVQIQDCLIADTALQRFLSEDHTLPEGYGFLQLLFAECADKDGKRLPRSL